MPYEMPLSLPPIGRRLESPVGKALLRSSIEAEAEVALRRALELRPGWVSPHMNSAMPCWSRTVPKRRSIPRSRHRSGLTGGQTSAREFSSAQQI